MVFNSNHFTIYIFNTIAKYLILAKPHMDSMKAVVSAGFLVKKSEQFKPQSFAQVP